MTDWTVAGSSLATAGGTLVLAVATFSSVRSANRSARIAERAFDLGLRPLLFPSRLEDVSQKIRWVDDHITALRGGRATIEQIDDVIYMSMSLRNAGSGTAVIHGWRAEPLPRAWHQGAIDPDARQRAQQQPSPDSFRPQSRDLYLPPGEISFWQGAIRESDDPFRDCVAKAVDAHEGLMIDLMYGDHEGRQRTISRFSATPMGDSETDWLCSVSRHWRLDNHSS